MVLDERASPTLFPVCVRYLAQPEFRMDCADFRDISDAPGTMMEYLLATQRFIIAARPIEHDRQQVHRLRAFMKSKQCASVVMALCRLLCGLE
jgi:hypothetical protein